MLNTFVFSFYNSFAERYLFSAKLDKIDPLGRKKICVRQYYRLKTLRYFDIISCIVYGGT